MILHMSKTMHTDANGLDAIAALSNQIEQAPSPILSSGRYRMGEVAERLRVHVATVWRWALHGVRGHRLATILIGGRRFVLASDLEKFVARGNENRPFDHEDLRARADAAGRHLDALGVATSAGPAPAHPAGTIRPTI
jgi:hypothetical protein